VIDRYGRKPLYITGSLGMALALGGLLHAAACGGQLSLARLGGNEQADDGCEQQADNNQLARSGAHLNVRRIPMPSNKLLLPSPHPRRTASAIIS